MIKQLERPIRGHLACSIVKSNDRYFFISTVNLPARRLVSVATERRDAWWTPPYPNETMVWECDKQGEKFGNILHCQGYRKPESAIRTHHKLCSKLEANGSVVLNGREHQTRKLDDGIPRGLVRELQQKTKGLVL